MTHRHWIFFLVIIGMAAIGCESHRARYLLEHPDLPGWVKESYMKGVPTTAMNEVMIRTLLGKPARVESDKETGDPIWKWGRIENWSDTGGRPYRGFVTARSVRFRKGLAVEVKP